MPITCCICCEEFERWDLRGAPPVACQKPECRKEHRRVLARDNYHRRKARADAGLPPPGRRHARNAEARDVPAASPRPESPRGYVPQQGVRLRPPPVRDRLVMVPVAAAVPPSLDLACRPTADQVRELAALVRRPFAQGAVLPECPACLRLRLGAPGSKVDGYLLCTKDEIVVQTTPISPKVQGSPILEDARGTVPVYWIRLDCANLGSARACRYFVTAPRSAMLGEAPAPLQETP